MARADDTGRGKRLESTAKTTVDKVGGLHSWVSTRHWAGWVVSGLGLALAGLSLWYLIIVKALYIGAAFDTGPVALALKVIEVGLLAGFSLVRETAEGERAKQQRNTLLFVNELLRHNVLNGMQIILGNTDLLREHVDEEGQPLLDTNEQRAETVVALIDDVRMDDNDPDGTVVVVELPYPDAGRR